MKTCNNGQPCAEGHDGLGPSLHCEQLGCQRIKFESLLTPLPAIHETGPDIVVTPQGARDIIEDALKDIGDARRRGLAEGLCGAFYMARLITEVEWYAYTKRIPAEVV